MIPHFDALIRVKRFKWLMKHDELFFAVVALYTVVGLVLGIVAAFALAHP